MASELKGVLESVRKEIGDSASFIAEYNEQSLQSVAKEISNSASFIAEYNAMSFKTAADEIVQGLTRVFENMSSVGPGAVAGQSQVEVVNKEGGREVEPIDKQDVKEAFIEGNKSFFGSDYVAKMKAGMAGVAAAAANGAKKAGGAVMKPVKGVWDSIKDALADAAVMVASLVAVFGFFKGMENATKWFGENADFGDKLAAVLATFIGKLFGFDEKESQELAQQLSDVFHKIADAFKWIVEKIGVLPTIIAGLALYFIGPTGIITMLSTIGSFLASMIMPALSALGSFFTGTILPFITGTLMPALAPVLAIGAAIVAAAGTLYTVIKGVIDGFDSAMKTFKETGSIWEAVKAFFAGFSDSVLGTLKKAKDFVVEGFRNMLSGLIDLVNGFIKYIPKVPYIPNPYKDGGDGGKKEAPEPGKGETAAPQKVATESKANAQAVPEQSKQNADTKAAQDSKPVVVAAPSGGGGNTNTTNNTTVQATQPRAKMKFAKSSNDF